MGGTCEPSAETTPRPRAGLRIRFSIVGRVFATYGFGLHRIEADSRHLTRSCPPNGVSMRICHTNGLRQIDVWSIVRCGL